MKTIVYKCGCTITNDMHTNEPTSVRHCEGHWYLFSADKTIRQMAQELADPEEHDVLRMAMRGEMARQIAEYNNRNRRYLVTGTGQSPPSADVHPSTEDQSS